MEQINQEFIIKQYQSGIQSYTDFTKEVGLWASEQFVCQTYFQKSDQILDVGCGAGRTTFGLFQLGYKNLMGVDLTPEMVESAKSLKKHFGIDIPFQVDNAMNLSFEDNRFDAVLFSFNGLMSIPKRENRAQALSEIRRVLKAEGIFIFTTHDREKSTAYFDFWKAETERWAAGDQDPRLFEFGDLITNSKNETSSIYIHIPNQQEVEQFLKDGGFRVVDTFFRSDRFQESLAVKEKSGECRFWVAQKM